MSSNIKTFTIAGFDPSLSNIGAVKLSIQLDLANNCEVVDYSIIDAGLSETKPNKKKVSNKNIEDLGRATIHRNFMVEFLKGVDFCFVELPTGSQTARASVSYGVCLGLFAAIEQPLFVVTPTELKMASVGSKTATKNEMVEWAKEYLPDQFFLKGSAQTVLNKNEHIADALAAVLAGVQSADFKKATLFI